MEGHLDGDSIVALVDDLVVFLWGQEQGLVGNPFFQEWSNLADFLVGHFLGIIDPLAPEKGMVIGMDKTSHHSQAAKVGPVSHLISPDYGQVLLGRSRLPGLVAPFLGVAFGPFALKHDLTRGVDGDAGPFWLEKGLNIGVFAGLGVVGKGCLDLIFFAFT